MSVKIKLFMVSVSAALTVSTLGHVLDGPENKEQPALVLGTGRGIDHVVIVVRNLEDALRAYRDVLGFTTFVGGSFPGGVRNGGVTFGSNDVRSNYLELATVDAGKNDATKDSSELAGYLAKREGAFALGLNISSAQQTADFLGKRGFDVTGPEGSSFTPNGLKEVKTNLWQTVSFNKPVVPADAVFFIQYASRQRKCPEHANTAVGIHSVWMAVNDLDAASKAYESIGLRAERRLPKPQLGAIGQEIAAGQGVILLLHPDDPKGMAGSFLTQYGEGIIGVSIEVQDLHAARALLRANIKQGFRPYAGFDGEAILIPPNLTHGVWIELFQKPRL